LRELFTGKTKATRQIARLRNDIRENRRFAASGTDAQTLKPSANGYDIFPAVVPTANRTYADRQTQAAFDAWNAGVQSLARMLTESTLETQALREHIRKLAGME
jgi:hypothetical protein